MPSRASASIMDGVPTPRPAALDGLPERLLRSAVVGLAMLVACSEVPSVGGGGTDTGTIAGSSRSGRSSGEVEPAPPEVIDIGHDVLLLRMDQPVTITAVVVDPNGDVVSGELLGPGFFGLFNQVTAKFKRPEIGSAFFSFCHN